MSTLLTDYHLPSSLSKPSFFLKKPYIPPLKDNSFSPFSNHINTEPSFIEKGPAKRLSRLLRRSENSFKPINFRTKSQTNNSLKNICHKRTKTVFSKNALTEMDESYSTQNINKTQFFLGKIINENEKLEKETFNFYEKFAESDNNVSVVEYLEHFFGFLEILQRNLKEKTLQNTLKNISKIIKLPFERIMEQFEKMRNFYERKNAEKQEIRKLDDCIKSLFKENEKLKQQMKENKENYKENNNIYEKLTKENELLKAIILKQKISISELSKQYIENKKESRIKEINPIKIEEKHENNSIYCPEKPEKIVKNPKISQEIKEKLKLDLAKVKANALERSGLRDIEQLNVIKEQNIICFHDEFMSKFDEFSNSWKGEAVKQRKFLNNSINNHEF